MRHIHWVCALALTPSAALGQVPDTATIQSREPPAAWTASPDSAIRPECDRVGDSLCLTRREAIATALARNPQLVVAKEQTAQARARLVQAKSIPDPVFGAFSVQSKGLFSGAGTEESIGALLAVPFPDKIRLRGEIGSADVRSAESSAELQHQVTAAQASQAYDALLAALRRRRDQREAVALARDFYHKTDARVEAGTAPKFDLIRARVEVAEAENELFAGERDVADARAALNRLMDRPQGTPIFTADSLAVPPAIPGLDTLVGVALLTRPELASLRSQQEGAHASTTLAQEYWTPDLIFGVTHDYADPGAGVLTSGIAFPIPLFFWQHSQGEIAEARHRELELAATQRDLQAAIVQEVRVAYSAALSSLRQAIYLRDEVLPSASEAYRIAFASYGLGGSSSLDVIDARRTLLDARRQYTEALAAANSSRAELERAIAAPLETLPTGDPHDR